MPSLSASSSTRSLTELGSLRLIRANGSSSSSGSAVDSSDCGSNRVGSADGVGEWLDAALAQKRKVMGFGHRVYRNGDSRVPTMKAALDTLIAEYDRPDLLRLYDTLEAAMTARTGILPNLDYPSGPAYSLIGFDTEMFTPLFVASRVTGWTAHVMEQLESNALIRPLSLYTGPGERSVPA